MTALSIGKLSKSTDVKVPTIRFYEQIGLLPEPDRTDSDRRVYGDRDVRRLAFIKHARQLGFTIDGIRTLLALSDQPDRDCDEANRLAQEQLAAVESKIAQLQALRGELWRMVEARCRGAAADCRVIETLADHARCMQDHVEPSPFAR
ncbi:MAG: helix-turn-helix domain-containing protein [Pseudomonadota bacterium]|jgi:DNA-binding transcriptional MerR regulator|uniref:Transcriptional regulator n=1 Tax=Phenylobacterium kunshanense TaxID=1445034 RepID=A0A328BBD0_9CAUL|nr:helix-turn-helix domain-containing protein [Phenylobacterium kunshanense]RAK63136.1 transcriptional regulator [Phenylobacterium kunshanense]